MDVDSDAYEDVPFNETMLALAAHPLNSCNPPPTELPDLLDSLIASEGRLRIHMTNCDNMAGAISRRLSDLKKRLLLLQGANAHFKREARTSNGKTKGRLSEERLIFQVKERVLQKMCFQVAFIHHMFVQRIRGLASVTLKAHHEILDEFLGHRHDHAGIEIADSTLLSCISDCDWYRKHGPYEWSKKPYTNMWWRELNHTDWDWLRMKEHIAAVVSVGGGKVNAIYATFHANAMKFVPSWFWADDFETWKMFGEVEATDNQPAQGRSERKVIIKIRFNRVPAVAEKERLQQHGSAQKAGSRSTDTGGDYSVQSTSNFTVEADKTEQAVLDEALVFDGMAQMPGAPGQGPQQIRWLSWWGFEKWYAEASKG